MGKISTSILFAFFVLFIICSCGKKEQNNLGIKQTEITFKSTKINNQIWLTENLDVSKFGNGDSIPEVKTNKEWQRLCAEGKPCWCFYENDSQNGKKYGKLYNWYAVKDKRGLAPKGWHIPNVDEWDILINNLGGSDLAGLKMKAATGWNINGNGNNESGFNGLPGGYRSDDGSFGGTGTVGATGSWWTTISNDEHKIARGVSLICIAKSVSPIIYSHRNGLSVRCIKD